MWKKKHQLTILIYCILIRISPEHRSTLMYYYGMMSVKSIVRVSVYNVRG